MILFWVFTGVVLLFGFVVAFGAPYVPSLKKEVRSAFKSLYPLSGKDVLVDLGSGDGQVLVEAARYGTKGYGYELNPLLVLISRLRLRHKAVIRLANMWTVQLPADTTIVYCFAVSRDSKKLSARLQNESTRLNRSLTVMTFGAPLVGFQPLRTLNAHNLYEVRPLQP